MAQEEAYAAQIIAQPDSYADVFVESPTTQFHEYVGPPDRQSHEVRTSRMAAVDRSRLAGAPQRNDLFVDSPHNGPPFHEKFGDKGPSKIDDVDREIVSPVAERMRMLGQSRVVAAYLRMLETTEQ